MAVMPKLALQADVCYNEDLNSVVLGGAGNTPSRLHRARRCNVNTVPHSASNDNSSLSDLSPFSKRFWRKVDKSDNCWLWTGYINPRGYGRFRGDGAHRFAWELTYGPIPEGLLICHRCNNPRCVNPDHLYPGTPQNNMDDKVAAGHHRNMPRGEHVKNSKLTAMQVTTIRERYSYGGKAGQTLLSLSKEYGVSHETIRLIVSNQTWKE